MKRSRGTTEAKRHGSKKQVSKEHGSKARDQPPKGHAVNTQTAKAMMAFIEKTVSAGIEGLKKEYEKFGQLKNKASVAFKENTLKNRYGNVYCFDSTRVVLSYQVPPESDYIHANRVTSNIVTLDSSFICTQAPIEKTINDFWRMVWQEKPKFIVMLCRLYENRKPKCVLYWPESEGETKVYGTITVTNDGDGGKKGEQVFDIENLRVQADNTSFVVKHIRWLDWPDFGIPQTGLGMPRVLRRIDMDKGTAIIHCSAGIGRTGTLLAAEIIMKALSAGQNVNVPQVVQNLRDQRYGMIQTASQYIYLHFSICGYIERKLESVPEAKSHLKRLKIFVNSYNEFAKNEEAADRKLAAQGFETRNATNRKQ